MEYLSSAPASQSAQARKVTHHTLTTRLASALSAVKRLLERWQPGSPARGRGRLLLGAEVRHGGYGVGQVVSHWPDGRILVRFERLGENLLVWPSTLDQRAS